jgi:hypothetical protein
MEWLKNILGDGYSDEVAEKMRAAIDKDYAPRGELEAAEAAKKGAQAQLAEANTTLESLKGLDPQAAQKAADEWQVKYAALQEQSGKEIAGLKFAGVFGEAVKRCYGRSAASIRAELGEEKYQALLGGDNQLEAAIQAINTLKGAQDKTFLFDLEKAPPATAAGAGTGAVDDPPGEADEVRAAIAAKLFPKT